MIEKLNVIVDQLKTLNLKEATDLVNQIETEFKVDTTAKPQQFPTEFFEKFQAMQTSSGTVQDPPKPVPIVEEKDSFNIILEDVPSDKKIAILKIIRVVTGLGLKECKDIVDNPPKLLKEGVPRAEAESIKKELEDAGAKVTLK